MGPKYIELAASLAIGYAIHDFMVQVLVTTTTVDKFKRVIKIVYIGAMLFYTYISLGGFAIINR